MLLNSVQKYGDDGLYSHNQGNTGHKLDMMGFVPNQAHCNVHGQRTAEHRDQQKGCLPYTLSAGHCAQLVKNRHNDRNDTHGGEIPQGVL